MMKAKLLVLLFALSSVFSFAQTDSITVQTAQWIVQTIAPGVELKQYAFPNNLFKSNQYVSILDIKPSHKLFFDLAYQPKELVYTSRYGDSTHSIAALNGTFFDTKNGGSVDFIKSDGQIISENNLDKNKRARHQQAALVFKNGHLKIAKWNGSSDWEKHLKGQDVMSTGPLLLFKKQKEALDTGAFNYLRHPRTAVAITKNKHVLFIAVDGRDEHAAGMNLYELTDLIRWLNGKDGVNLDGGGSTTLWVAGQPENGVVNNPSDDKKWGHQGERKVANAVLLKYR
jgi:exopolysaccharide biosynthesis protein